MGRAFVMVGQSGVASGSPVLMHDNGTANHRISAPIVRFPVAKLPPVKDYARACANLIAATFPARSQSAIGKRAAMELPFASADTFERILAGDTQRIDSYLMRAVMQVAHFRNVPVPPELAVRP